MPDCLHCTHSSVLHTDGMCSIPGCACDQLKMPEMTPDVKPPKPGACLHIAQEGSVWTIEEMTEVKEKIDEGSEFVEFTACDFEARKYCTYEMHVRPQAILSYHSIVPERWERILESILG